MSELFSHSPLPESFNRGPSGPSKASLAAVPSPPKEDIEVSIRTMTSDLELMAKSGGNIHAAKGLSQFGEAGAPVSYAPKITSAAAAEPEREPVNYRKYILIAGGALGVTIVFGVGYYILPMLTKKSPAPVVREQQGNGAVSTSTANTLPASFVHTSFFQVPIDARFIFTTESFTEAAPYKTRLVNLASTTPENILLTEIDMKNGNASLPWQSFAATAGIPFVEPSFWTERFEEDFTLFAYRLGKAYFPGYVLKAKANQSPLVLRNLLLRLESDPQQIANMFPIPPKGAPEGWTDTIIEGEPARMLRYGTVTEAFYYGLTGGKYLIMSTTLEGYKEAKERL